MRTYATPTEIRSTDNLGYKVSTCKHCGHALILTGLWMHSAMGSLSCQDKLCVDCQRPFQGPGTGCPDCQALALSILRRGQGVSC